MNRTNAVLVLSAVLLGAAASSPAFAWRGGGVRFGVVVGAPFYPWYYPPYYYYPPYPYPAVAPAAPTTYVEQGGARPAPAQPSSYWYYCEASKTYYPYVKECAAGWLRVVPQATPNTAPQSTPQQTAAPQAAPG
ncbi:MAG TPA: hypothetical protein VFA36_08730 [Burkholderiales bacterium]|jgi:hypothetical protein|nr:hypothetical protein [Burkholderiales bacterium]